MAKPRKTVMTRYKKADGTVSRFKLATATRIYPQPSGAPAGEVYRTGGWRYVVKTKSGEWHEWTPPVGLWVDYGGGRELKTSARATGSLRKA